MLENTVSQLSAMLQQLFCEVSPEARSLISAKCSRLLVLCSALTCLNSGACSGLPTLVSPAMVSKPRCSGVREGHSNHLQAFKRVKGKFETVFLTGLEIPILSPETLLITHCHNLSVSAKKKLDLLFCTEVCMHKRNAVHCGYSISVNDCTMWI